MHFTKIVSFFTTPSEVTRLSLYDASRISRPITWVDKMGKDKLTISSEPYFIERSKADGEEDLKALAFDGVGPGMFAYIPSINTWLSLMMKGMAAPLSLNGMPETPFRMARPNFNQFNDTSIDYYFCTSREFVQPQYDLAYSRYRKIEGISEESAHHLADLSIALHLALPNVLNLRSFLTIARLFINKAFTFTNVTYKGKLTFSISPKAYEYEIPLVLLMVEELEYMELIIDEDDSVDEVTNRVLSLDANRLIQSKVALFNERFEPSFSMRYEAF